MIDATKDEDSEGAPPLISQSYGVTGYEIQFNRNHNYSSYKRLLELSDRCRCNRDTFGAADSGGHCCLAVEGNLSFFSKFSFYNFFGLLSKVLKILIF